MKYKKLVSLKDDEKCIIRNAVGSDASEVYSNFNLTHAQTDFLLSYPDENSYDIEKEEHFLTEKINSDYEVELCAVVNEKIVATAGIEAIGRKYKVKHRAELGISVDKAYWGRGIGCELMKSCIDCAKKAGYKQLELSVVADNTSAVTLYKKLGFVEYGRNPKGFCSRLSGWQEIILMRLEIN